VKKYTDNEVARDWKYSEIEKRNLQFLLPRSERVLYQVWCRRPKWYKEAVRNIPTDQTLNDLAKFVNDFGGNSEHTGDS
jgi:hypothetical protein